MKYEIEGNGEPIVVLHGSFGGIEQSKLMGRELRDEGYMIIAVSRPGYPGTPIKEGESPGEQAELIAEILEQEEIDTTHLLGYSAGAPAALEFLKRYPEKAEKTIFAGAVVTESKPSNILDRVFHHDLVYNRPMLEVVDYTMRLLGRVSPGTAYSIASGSPLETEEDLKYFKEFLKTVPPLRAKKNGLKNDLNYPKESPEGLEEIDKPALVINHGEMPEVEESTDILSRLPECRVEVFNNGGHLTWMQNSSKVRKTVLEFLKTE